MSKRTEESTGELAALSGVLGLDQVKYLGPDAL